MNQAQQERLISYARDQLPSVFDYDYPVIFQAMQYFYYEEIAWVFSETEPPPDTVRLDEIYQATVVFRKDIIFGIEVGWEFVKII